jgi:hypothetical protein
VAEGVREREIYTFREKSKRHREKRVEEMKKA